MTVARLARILRQRWRALVRQRAADAELDAELTFHLEALIAEKIADGHSPGDARRAALRDFGNVTAFAEASRDTRGWTWLQDVPADLRYAWRVLRRAPLFSTVAILSLGLAIGGAATVAAGGRAVFWKPSPFPDADRLVVIRTIAPETPDRRQGVTVGEFDAWRDRGHVLEDIGLSLSSPRDLGVEAEGPYAERLASHAATPSVLRMLGVQPQQGRLFQDATSPYSQAAKELVLSHRLWQSRYGGAPDVIGRVVPTDGGTRTIVGILPPGFPYDHTVAFWIPLIPIRPADERGAVGRPFVIFARLRPGVSIDHAERELTAILAEMSSHLPDRFRGRRAVIERLHESLYGWTRPLLSTLFSAAVLLLTIACANVTGLLLARATTRQREVWVRLSLGAARGRIVRQLLVESALLAAGGGLVALAVSGVGVRALTAALGPPPGAPWVDAIPFDLFVLATVTALSALAALVCGLPTALAAVRLDRRANTTRIRSVIVAAEVALAVLMLVGAGLLGHSFSAIVGRPLGFDPDRLGSFQYVVANDEFAKRTGADGVLPVFSLSTLPADAIARVHARLREVPGIESIGGMTNQPVNSLITPRFPVRPVAGGASAAEDSRTVAGYLVTPEFFATMRTPILRGREVVDGDTTLAPPVVVINEAAASLLFPGRDAIAEQLVVEFSADAPAREVVGVVADIPVIRRVLAPEPIVYIPSRQMPAIFRGGGTNFFGVMTFVYRYSGDETAVLAAARRAVAEVDARRPLVDPGVVTRALHARVPELATYVGAVSLTSLAAMLLAAIGVYGVTAFAVSTRAREIAIRQALGADRRAVLTVIGRHSLWLVCIGIVIGVASSIAVTPLIGSQLIGVEPGDPLTLVSAALLIAIVAAAACVLPARRALAVPPSVVLRAE